MNESRSPIAAGLSAAFRHRRLALVLWLSLVASAFAVWFPLGALSGGFDQSPFRESLLAGWDSWGVLTWIGFHEAEWRLFLASVTAAFLVAVLLQLFVAGGVIRTLIADVNRPVFRRVIADSAALFRPTLWAFSRYLITLAFWIAILVAVPVKIFEKIAGDDAPPHGLWSGVSFWWAVLLGAIVFLNVTARFDLARIALAQDLASNARGAYRVAKQRLRGNRGSVAALLLFWLAAGLVVQGLFTNMGVKMNPSTSGGMTGLLFFRQFGFAVLAATRVGLWASLLAWEKARRPAPRPVPSWLSSPVAPMKVEPVAEPVGEPVVEPFPEPPSSPEGTPA